MTTFTSQSVTASVPPHPSMSHAEQSPAAVGGSVRGDLRSGLGAATSRSPVNATLAHPMVGGLDQIPNPLTASPVSSYTRFHQLVRLMAIRLQTTRVPDQTIIRVLPVYQQSKVSAITSLATLITLSPRSNSNNTSTTTSIANYLPALTVQNDE